LGGMGPGWGSRRLLVSASGASGRPLGRAGSAAVAAAVLVTGCTADMAGDRAEGGRRSESGPALSATVSPPDRTAVVGGRTPGALSVAVSRELFDAAPVVVVAAADDASGISRAASQAERLGVPVLLDDGTALSSRPATSLSAPATSLSAPATPLSAPASPLSAPASSLSAPATPATSAPATPATPAQAAPAQATPATGSAGAATTEAFQGEIGRLRPRAVLAVGSAVATRVAEVSDARVVTDPAALPILSPPPGLAGLVVLVTAGGDASTRAGAAAAAATASAAGAGVVRVRGGDPRADPAAIAALAKQPPRRVLAAGAGFGPADRLAERVAVAATGRQLPGRGQVVFPGRRLVALYGHPGTPALGVLGEQGPDASIARARTVAAPYRQLSDVPVIPAFEIIATVATGGPGGGGNYSFEASVASLRPWVEKAGAAGMYVVLDLQPGRTDFLTQAKLYAPLLRLPYVGLALDPEWRLGPGQRPLQQIGSVSAQEINAVSAWLADLTAAGRLPQKLLVLHQFRLSMIRDPAALDTGHDELALLVHMDGQGPPSSKDDTWRAVTRAAPKGVPFGWKNFYDEDKPILTPAQTMSKRPAPVMISYQ